MRHRGLQTFGRWNASISIELQLGALNAAQPSVVRYRDALNRRTRAIHRARSTLEVTMGSIVRRFAVLSFLVVAAAPVEAQGRPLPPLPAHQRVAGRQAVRQAGRQAVRQRVIERAVVRENAVARERAAVRHSMMRERIRNMTPAQRQRLVATREAFRAERQRIGNALRNGSITQEQGRQKLQEWRREHRPNAGLRGPRRPGAGE